MTMAKPVDKFMESLALVLLSILVSATSIHLATQISKQMQELNVQKVRLSSLFLNSLSTFFGLKGLTIRVVIFVWLEEGIAGRGEWRYTSMENGWALILIVLMLMMLG